MDGWNGIPVDSPWPIGCTSHRETIADGSVCVCVGDSHFVQFCIVHCVSTVQWKYRTGASGCRQSTLFLSRLPWSRITDREHLFRRKQPESDLFFFIFDYFRLFSMLDAVIVMHQHQQQQNYRLQPLLPSQTTIQTSIYNAIKDVLMYEVSRSKVHNSMDGMM